jgi:hypothetical protein
MAIVYCHILTLTKAITALIYRDILLRANAIKYFGKLQQYLLLPGLKYCSKLLWHFNIDTIPYHILVSMSYNFFFFFHPNTPNKKARVFFLGNPVSLI